MTTPAARQVQDFLRSGEQSAWSLVALALALRADTSDDLAAAARHVTGAAGLELGPELGELDPAGAAAQAAAPLLQVAQLLQPSGDTWDQQSDESLVAQGRMSAQSAAMFARFMLPVMPGLADALDRPGARMLDVGTGVAALAVAYAEHFPRLHVVGLDVMPRVLAIAERRVAASAVADRVTVRQQDVATVDECDEYDLAWLPAPFVPPAAFAAAVPAIARALRPGGWIMVGHGKFAGDPLDDAITRFKTVAYGGTALDDAGAASVVTAAGLVDVVAVPTPPGAPAITVARRA